MKGLRTYKLKIITGIEEFTAISNSFKDACNWLSHIIYNRRKINTPNHLSREFYSVVREKFNLPSQVTCSLFRHVISTYRSMKSNKQWHLAIYKKLVVPLCWKRDFNIRKKGVSIWGNLITYQSRPLPQGKWSDSKLKFEDGQWYLCLTIQTEISELKTTGGIIGVDRGQKNVFCAIDPKTNKTLYIRGGPLNHKRLCIRQTRAKVASVGTRSAHRCLQRLNRRERTVTQETMHVASKQLVAFAQSVGAKTIVMENLTGFKKNSTKKNKTINIKQRARNNRWPYSMLNFFTTYKAAVYGIGMEYVLAKNTSRGCPRCGHVSESNRSGMVFRCVVCGFADNADRVGATNVALRSLLQRQAFEERAACQSAYSSSQEHRFS